jgi:predicted PP-loop superfamily ATPase
MVVFRPDAMFGKRAILHLNAALAASKPAATDTLNIHTKLARSIQHNCPLCDLPSPSGRHKYYVVFRL